MEPLEFLLTLTHSALSLQNLASSVRQSVAPGGGEKELPIIWPKSEVTSIIQQQQQQQQQ